MFQGFEPVAFCFVAVGGPPSMIQLKIFSSIEIPPYCYLGSA